MAGSLRSKVVSSKSATQTIVVGVTGSEDWTRLSAKTENKSIKRLSPIFLESIDWVTSSAARVNETDSALRLPSSKSDRAIMRENVFIGFEMIKSAGSGGAELGLECVELGLHVRASGAGGERFKLILKAGAAGAGGHFLRGIRFESLALSLGFHAGH